MSDHVVKLVESIRVGSRRGEASANRIRQGPTSSCTTSHRGHPMPGWHSRSSGANCNCQTGTTQHSTSNNCSNDWSSGGHGVGSVDNLDIVRLSLSAVIKIWEEFRGPPSARLFDSGKGIFVRYRMYVCVVLAAVLGARLLCCGAQMGAGGTMLGAGRWVVGPVVNRTSKNNPESSGHCRPAALWNIEI